MRLLTVINHVLSIIEILYSKEMKCTLSVAQRIMQYINYCTTHPDAAVQNLARGMILYACSKASSTCQKSKLCLLYA